MSSNSSLHIILLTKSRCPLPSIFPDRSFFMSLETSYVVAVLTVQISCDRPQDGTFRLLGEGPDSVHECRLEGRTRRARTSSLRSPTSLTTCARETLRPLQRVSLHSVPTMREWFGGAPKPVSTGKGTDRGTRCPRLATPSPEGRPRTGTSRMSGASSPRGRKPRRVTTEDWCGVLGGRLLP